MNLEGYRFPFGAPLRAVEQADRTPKDVFVLGVYSSAVHARWIGPDGEERAKALAVASEPYIFWKGDGAAEIIAKVPWKPELGRLEPAGGGLNGPSGVALDDLILGPLGVKREQAWLCDLVPYSCRNPSQAAAIARAYEPVRAQFDLPEATIPEVPKPLADDARRAAILDELRASKASDLVLLGDEPIRGFLRGYVKNWRKLADFGPDGYGERHPIVIDDLRVSVIPLAHPRQIAGLGLSSPEWRKRHEAWVEAQARRAASVGRVRAPG